MKRHDISHETITIGTPLSVRLHAAAEGGPTLLMTMGACSTSPTLLRLPPVGCLRPGPAMVKQKVPMAHVANSTGWMNGYGPHAGRVSSQRGCQATVTGPSPDRAMSWCPTG